MKFAENTYSFESLFRPNYELRMAFSWLVCALLCAAFNLFAGLPFAPVLVIAAVCVLLAYYYFAQAKEITRVHQGLRGRALEFIDLKDFIELTRHYSEKGEIYLGNAFPWTPVHTQRAYEMLKQEWGKADKSVSDKLEDKVNYFDKLCAQDKGLSRLTRLPANLWKAARYQNDTKIIGQRWIHGLNLGDKPLSLPAELFQSHTLIVGTTGAGKTRLFSLLITQAICRGEAVFIIDPKGDKDLQECAHAACDAYRAYCLQQGQPDPGERFFSFHPGHPELSECINFLANSSRDTDIPTRIADLVPGSGGNSATFKAFAWSAVNAVTACLQILGITPTLVNVKINYENQLKDIGLKAIIKWAREHDEVYNAQNPDSPRHLEDVVAAFVDSLGPGYEGITLATISPALLQQAMLTSNYSKDEGFAVISTIFATLVQDPGYYAKTTNNLAPVLAKLTAGPLEHMLSATAEHLSPEQRLIDTKTIIARKGVFYLSLDSLTDGEVAKCIGFLALSDLAAVAGDIYNFQEGKKVPINLYVDEAAECMNDACIRILNKGRGAGMRVTIATQTIADFTDILGSEAKKDKVLGNVNSVICLRVQDTSSRKTLSEALPTTTIKVRSLSQGINSLTDAPLEHGGSVGESLSEQETALIAPELLGLLPGLEYIANFAGGQIYKGAVPIITTPVTEKAAPVSREDDYANFSPAVDRAG